MVSDIGADVAMISETKLMSACVVHDLHSHQTLDIRRGGCATFTRTHLHRKVIALGNYLLWSRIPMGSQQLHLLNIYIEPGNTQSIHQRVARIVEVVYDILR
jgi:hypothetical protein